MAYDLLTANSPRTMFQPMDVGPQPWAAVDESAAPGSATPPTQATVQKKKKNPMWDALAAGLAPRSSKPGDLLTQNPYQQIGSAIGTYFAKR